MRGFILLSVLLLLVGCSRSAPGDAPDPIARSFIEKLENQGRFKGDMAWDYISESTIESQTNEKLRDDLFQSAIVLLKDDSPKTRIQALKLLRYLKPKESAPELLIVINDPDDDVRCEACWVYQWRSIADQKTRDALVLKRKDDPSVLVRVAATFGLEDFQHNDALAALEAGLLDRQVREACVRELDRHGKLKLPLPAQVYERITPEGFASERAYAWRSVIRHCVRQQGKVYFQLSISIDPAIAFIERWYSMPEEEFDKNP
jgi:hypothetical protein